MDQFFASNVGKTKSFNWSQLGDIKQGRGNLGEEMPVIVYRLMQYTIMDVLYEKFGREEGGGYIRDAGYLAGIEFSKNVLDLNLNFDEFISNLRETLKALKIGILRVESSDTGTGEMVLTISEDLDCSGLSIMNESVCIYDEGFLSGILEMYTGKKYTFREVDCWATGDRVCRFKGNPV